MNYPKFVASKRSFASNTRKPTNIVMVPASRLDQLPMLKSRAEALPEHTALFGVPNCNARIVGVAHLVEAQPKRGRESLAVLISPIR